MEALRPEVDWTDCDRVSVLFGPLPSKNLNPESWNAKVNFWIETIERWLDKEKESSFSVEVLEAQLTFQGRKCYCLKDVLAIMHTERKSLCTLEELYSNLASKESTWPQWTLSLLKKGATGLASTIFGLKKNPNMFVHNAKLKDRSVKVLKTLKSHEKCFRFKKSIFLELSCLAEVLDICDREKELVIKFLQANRFCDIQMIAGDVTFLKFPEKDETATKFSQDEKNFLTLKTYTDDLNSQIEVLDETVRDLRAQVKLALREENRSKAKLLLRKLKRKEKIADKKRNIVDNIDQILTSIEESVTNVEASKCFSIGLQALKTQLGAMSSVEETEEILDEIRDLISEGEAISEVVASPDEDDSDLLRELELLATEESSGDASLLNRLNELEVVTTSPDIDKSKTRRKEIVLS